MAVNAKAMENGTAIQVTKITGSGGAVALNLREGYTRGECIYRKNKNKPKKKPQQNN